MFLKIQFLFLCFYFLFDTCSLEMMRPKNSESYGPYELQYTGYHVCKGPKNKDSAEVIFKIENRTGVMYAVFNLTMVEDTHLEETRIIVYSLKKNRKSVLWNYRIKKPCQHFLIAGIMEHYFKAIGCVLKKGNVIVEMDYSDLTKQFLGASFFYGEYIMKSYGIAKKSNVMCITLNMNVIKKKN